MKTGTGLAWIPAIVVFALLPSACKTATPIGPSSQGWLQWDRSGHGTLVATSGSGPAGDSPVNIDEPQPPWLTAHLKDVVDGVVVDQAVDIYSTPSTRLTVDGRRSTAIGIRDGAIEVPNDTELHIAFENRRGRLFALSIDASTTALGLARRNGDLAYYDSAGRLKIIPRSAFSSIRPDAKKRAEQAAVEPMKPSALSPLPLPGSSVRDLVALARKWARSSSLWLQVNGDGLGFVRGTVSGSTVGEPIAGPGYGVFTRIEVSAPESLHGVRVLHETGMSMDRRSMLVRGSRVDNLLAVQRSTKPEALQDWPDSVLSNESSDLFVVRRVGQELLLLVAIPGAGRIAR